jgi:hypothetical protein
LSKKTEENSFVVMKSGVLEADKVSVLHG